MINTRTKKTNDPVLDQLKSVLNFSPKDQLSIFSKGRKYFLRTKGDPLGRYGGYCKYFENLSKIKYKDSPSDFVERSGGQRTLNFAFKYMASVEKILLHPKPLRILDLGCSSGFLRRVLEANVFSPQEIYYYGVDIREDVLKRAVFETEDIETGASGDYIPSLYLNYDLKFGLPFIDNAFDFVVSFEAIKYLEKSDASKLFGEVSRVLKKKKTFIYSTAGVFENEKSKEMILRAKGDMVSLWDYTELKKTLEHNNLFLMKTYCSELDYCALRSDLKSENDYYFNRMEALYPPELIAAILGPFHPSNNPTKLFFLSNGKYDLLKEISHILKGESISELKHRGNAKIFVAGDKIVKYLPSYLLEKNLRSYRVLKEHTGIKLPRLIKVGESGISENYYLIMEKIEGRLLGDIWDKLSIREKKKRLVQIVGAMKQIHSIHFNFENAPFYFKLIHRASNWRETVREFCQDSIDRFLKDNIINRNLYDFLSSIIEENIDYVTTLGECFLHGDLSLNNLIVDNESNLVILFDFETCLIGDKYLELFTASADWGKKDQEHLFKLYGVDNDFGRIAKIYRLFLFLRALRVRNTLNAQQDEVEEFVKKGGRLSSVVPL